MEELDQHLASATALLDGALEEPAVAGVLGAASTSLPDRAASDARILIVDDEPINLKVLRKHLAVAGFSNIATVSDPTLLSDEMSQRAPDVILLDIVMPSIDGLHLLRLWKADPRYAHVPVIILSAVDDRDTKIRALELGANDFLGKPVDSVELVPRVRNALVIKSQRDHLHFYAQKLASEVRSRTEELALSRLEVIHCLGRAAEYRDNDTGRHVIRVGRYASVIARQMGLTDPFIEQIELAAPLHDLGKLGVPDSILLKPGQLEPQEFEIMQKHCVWGKRTFDVMPSGDWKSLQSHTLVGERILGPVRSPVLEMASRIALTHHEKWDGTGYPLGLSGEDIPLESRITAVADVFDALSSKRPYKPAFPLEHCFQILEDNRGRHFDPRVLDAFFAEREEILRIRIECTDLD